MAKTNPGKYRPEFADLIFDCAIERESPFTDEEIRNLLAPFCPGGLHIATVYDWKKRHPEFCDACRQAKQVADAQVENALHKTAKGYDYEEVEEVLEGGVVVRRRVTKKHVPANVSAQRLWLANRQPERWKDVQQVQHTGGLAVTSLDLDPEMQRKIGDLIARERGAQPPTTEETHGENQD